MGVGGRRHGDCGLLLSDLGLATLVHVCTCLPHQLLLLLGPLAWTVHIVFRLLGMSFIIKLPLLIERVIRLNPLIVVKVVVQVCLLLVHLLGFGVVEPLGLESVEDVAQVRTHQDLVTRKILRH